MTNEDLIIKLLKFFNELDISPCQAGHCMNCLAITMSKIAPKEEKDEPN